MGALPDKPSELLLAAAIDGIKTQNTPGYVMNMGVWHEPRPDGQCAVCMAGSVMVQRLNVPRDQNTYFGSFNDRDIRGKLLAVNSMRVGYIREALFEMGVATTVLQQAAIYRAEALIEGEYDPDLGRACWSTYRKAAEILAKAGL